MELLVEKHAAYGCATSIFFSGLRGKLNVEGSGGVLRVWLLLEQRE